MKYLVMNRRSYCYPVHVLQINLSSTTIGEKNSTVGSFALFYHKLKAYIRVNLLQFTDIQIKSNKFYSNYGPSRGKQKLHI